jgi:integrase
MQKQQQESSIIIQGLSYDRFINAIKSPATRKLYRNSLVRYCKFLKISKVDDLMRDAESLRIIEGQIRSYIMSLRDQGIAYSTMKVLVAPIFTFYDLNDVLLKSKQVLRYLPEFKRRVKDKSYSIEQIQQMLVSADSRTRMIILIMASTGCRIGALPDLTLGSLTKIPEYGIYKIIFYEGTNNEYYTFCTRECALTGIDNYLEFRKRSGEDIEFNENSNSWEPAHSPLIRLHFDINDSLQIRHPQPMKLEGLSSGLNYHMNKCGIRQVQHNTETSAHRARKDVAFAQGFRKRVISTFIEAGLNHEIRELIVDHATHLDQNYFRPTEEQVLNEYLKAESYLTIDSSMRLAQEVQEYKIKAEKVDNALERIAELEKSIGI